MSEDGYVRVFAERELVDGQMRIPAAVEQRFRLPSSALLWAAVGVYIGATWSTGAAAAGAETCSVHPAPSNQRCRPAVAAGSGSGYQPGVVDDMRGPCDG